MLYLEPTIMASVDLPRIDVPHPPDLPALAVLVQELLGWEDRGKMLRNFRLKIWPVVVLKEVLMDLRRISPSGNEVSDLSRDLIKGNSPSSLTERLAALVQSSPHFLSHGHIYMVLPDVSCLSPPIC